MKLVVDEYPEFHTNLGAYAILRDSILVQPMSVLESATRIAKEYPILIHSAEFVTKALRDHFAANKPNFYQNAQPSEDSLSDSSSSESDSPMVSPNQRSGDIRQISRDQLSQALLLAGSASLNSLSNIAQRNASTSQATSASVPSTSSTSASTSASGLISNSMFSNALSQALMSTNSSSATPNPPSATQSQPSNEPAAANENLAERYVNELQTMHEMGLFDDLVNIQALTVSNGDVEAAINLVLSGLTFN